MRLPPCRPAFTVILSQQSSKSSIVLRARCQRRTLLTLAIETSCDDTAVAILDRSEHDRKKLSLLFNERIVSDNREFRGIEPTTAAKGHSREIAPLVKRALDCLPDATYGGQRNVSRTCRSSGGLEKQIPDFVTVTRGPGIRGSLEVGINIAKGLAVAWDVPLLGSHHMQAHALTPRLAQALGLNMAGSSSSAPANLEFPFLTLLVSGGHTQLVHSRSLTDHGTIINAGDSAIGNVLDQVARSILPPDILAAAEDVSYGRLLEQFAFPQDLSPAENYAFYQPPKSRQAEIDGLTSEYGWTITPALKNSRKLAYSFTGLHTKTAEILGPCPEAVGAEERRSLAKYTLAAAFTQLVGRICIALKDVPGLAECKTLVVSGGVASNKFLIHVLRETLRVRGYGDMQVLAPPLDLCTDNAAMIAWAGMEMWDAGWESNLEFGPISKWPMDPVLGDGILGVGGWRRR